ncbi:MAG TPA: DUF2062 domain-containing protein [Ignavibacteriaceae bacterium]|nr:DUF2062 domain-containing protein [Ignavibacteriaceae bacterium]
MKERIKKFRAKDALEELRKKSLRENIGSILNLKGDPTHIAMSFVIGFFFGLIIPMGLQTVVAIPVALALECNLFVSWLATLITNPITVVPIYLFAIRIGSLFTSNTGGIEKITSLLQNPSLGDISVFSKYALTDLIIGIFILAIVASLLSFLFVRYSIIYYRKIKRLENNA